MRRLLAAAGLAALAACAPRVPPPDLSLAPEPLRRQVEEAAGRVRALRGEAKVRVKGPGAAAVTALVAAERPDRLRVEVLDFFGSPGAVLVSGGGRLAIWDARAGTFTRGAATAANVARLVPLEVEPRALVAVLCGAPPLDGEAVGAEPGRGEAVLTVRDGARETTLHVGPGAAVTRAAVREPGGGYEVTYGQRTRTGGAEVPDLVVRGAGREADLDWTEVEANVPLDPLLFTLEPRPGARVVDLDG